MCIYIYIYIERERELLPRQPQGRGLGALWIPRGLRTCCGKAGRDDKPHVNKQPRTAVKPSSWMSGACVLLNVCFA